MTEGELRRITNDQLEKKMPIFSRSVIHDIAPLNANFTLKFLWWMFQSALQQSLFLFEKVTLEF